MDLTKKEKSPFPFNQIKKLDEFRINDKVIYFKDSIVFIIRGCISKPNPKNTKPSSEVLEREFPKIYKFDFATFKSGMVGHKPFRNCVHL